MRAIGRGQNFSEIRINREKGEINEDTDYNSNSWIGVTVHGARPDNGAAADAGANESAADYCAGKREENAS